MSRAEKVSESETIKSHIPSFLELIAKGEAPPDQRDSTIPSYSASLTFHRPRRRSKNRKTQSPSMKCQYIETTSVAVLFVSLCVGRKATYRSARTPPRRWRPCAAVKT